MAEPDVVATGAGLQASQSALVSLMADPLDAAWSTFHPGDPSNLDRFILALQALIHRFGKMSGSHAAKAYEAQRRAAGVTGAFTARPGPIAAPDKVANSVRWATRGLFVPEPDTQAAHTLVQGVVEKNVLDTGRQTIIDAVKADPKAKGWARETSPGACSFCALLATRGMALQVGQVGRVPGP